VQHQEHDAGSRDVEDGGTPAVEHPVRVEFGMVERAAVQKRIVEEGPEQHVAHDVAAGNQGETGDQRVPDEGERPSSPDDGHPKSHHD
jgi:hypothetical protein